MNEDVGLRELQIPGKYMCRARNKMKTLRRNKQK